MTIASVGTLGSVGSASANQASATLTLSAQADVGNHVIIAIAVDNNTATTNTDESAVTGIVDSASGGSNTWVKCGEISNSAGSAAQSGATISVWKCSPVVRAIANGGTITVSFNNQNSRDASAISAWEFSTNADSTLKTLGPASSVTNAGDPPSLNLTTASLTALRFRAIASETNSTTALTVTTNWTAIDGNRSGSGSAAANITVRGEFRIVAGTSAASDPTYVSADCASVYVAFQEEFNCVCAQGSYSLSGQAAVLRRDSNMAAGYAAYVWMQSVVSLGRSISAGQGSYSLVGQIAALKADRVAAATYGTYSLVSPNVALRTPASDALGIAANFVASAPVAASGFPAPSLGVTFPITASHGTYSLVGQTAALTALRSIVAAQGVYSLGGQVVGLAKPRSVEAAYGTYTLTGQSASLVHGYTIQAVIGTYTLTGQAAAIGQFRGISAEYGTYSLLGQAATVSADFPLGVASAVVAGFPVAGSRFPPQEFAEGTYDFDALHGSYLLFGSAAGLRRTMYVNGATGYYYYTGASSIQDYGILAAHGVYSLVGQDVGVGPSGEITFGAEYGTYSLDGQSVVLRADRRIEPEFVLYDYNGDDIAFTLSYVVTNESGEYDLLGQNVLFDLDGASIPLDADYGTYALTGQDIVLRTDHRVAGAYGDYHLNGQANAFMRALVADADHGTYSLTGQANVFTVVRNVSAAHGTYSLVGQVNTIKATRELDAEYGVYSLVGQPARLHWSAEGVGVGVNLNKPMMQYVGRMMAA